MIVEGRFSGPADELARWMICGGLQSLWTYNSDKSFAELIAMVVDDETDGWKGMPDQVFLERLYARLSQARAK